MSQPLITLTTDFGVSSPYVAQMKGVILGIQPQCSIVDITHNIAPQDVRGGAIALREATPHFPRGSIHVAVVDPGVGTARKLLYAEIGEQRYLAPDNGLLSLIAPQPPGRIRVLTESAYWRSEVSHTFHGRDILAPVAAHLSRGLAPAQLGPATELLTRLNWPTPRYMAGEVVGEVTHIDAYGNIISNITTADLELLAAPPGQQEICLQGQIIRGRCVTYGERQPGEWTALCGSSGFLEVAIVNGSAAAALGVRAGELITVRG